MRLHDLTASETDEELVIAFLTVRYPTQDFRLTPEGRIDLRENIRSDSGETRWRRFRFDPITTHLNRARRWSADGRPPRSLR